MKVDIVETPLAVSVKPIKTVCKVTFAEKGKDGYTPVKGIDYFDGEKGEPFEYDDFTPEQLEELKGPPGDTPEITKENIEEALGYTPAQSGYGYGDKMPWLNFNETTWATTGTFQSDLEAVFASMPMGTCKKVQLIDPDGLNAQKFVGEIWKYTDGYGVVTAVNYNGYKAVKTLYDNVWYPWEWEIPPMESGVEYRTTEHYEGLSVYVQCGAIGSLPNTSTVKFKVGKSGDILSNVVELTIQAISTSDSNIKHILPIIGGKNEIQAKVSQSNTREFTIQTYTNLSGYTAKYKVKYTK